MAFHHRALATLIASLCTGLAGAAPIAQNWLTTADQQALLTPGAPLAFVAGAPALPLHIEVDPAQRFQTMVGFGAAITDSSAWVIQHTMQPAQRATLMNELFGHGPNGLGFEFTRLTIGASDFSLKHYSLDDVPKGQTDMKLAAFSLAPVREDVVPVVRQALAVNPELKVMASPWSAPAWMKTTGSPYKGDLKPAMYDVFAHYLLKYVEGMQAEGVPIFALTLQNEPHFEPDNYPGMHMDPAARAAVIAHHLGPLLAVKAPQTQIFDWDHNWDHPEEPMGVLADPAARRYVSSVAWHCYDGTPDAQSPVHAAYPDKDVWLTECSGGEWMAKWDAVLPWIMHNLVIGATRNGARGVLMWNLALDENHGPHAGGCSDCRGIVTIDSHTGAVTRNVDYYAFGHASRFVRQGAQRIATSDSGNKELESVAFRNPDGSIALIVSNGSATAQAFSVGFAGSALRYELPPHSVVTLSWTPAQ